MTGSATPDTPVWRKSSHSQEENCVEIGELPGGRIGIRSSRDPDATVAAFTRADIDAFFRGVKGGEFDDLTRQ